MKRPVIPLSLAVLAAMKLPELEAVQRRGDELFITKESLHPVPPPAVNLNRHQRRQIKQAIRRKK